MNYYRKQPKTKESMRFNDTYQGETIEQKVQRITNNKEPIKDGAPLVYTDRKDGVGPQYDIRTDRFEVAVEAMDKVAKSEIARREMRIGERTYDTMTEDQQKDFNIKYPKNKHNKETGGQPIQGTADTQK